MKKKNMRSKEKGMTLIEVLIVVAIIGIVTALSGYSLTSYIPRSNLKLASRNIASMCQLARAEAIKRNTRMAVVFSAGNHTSTLYSDSGDGNWLTENDNAMLRRIDLSTIGSNVDFGHGAASVDVVGNAFGSDLPVDLRFEFDGRGTLRASSTDEDKNTVYIQNGMDATMAITIHASGGVMSREWRGGMWQ